MNKARDLIHNMRTIVSNNVLYTSNLPKEWSLDTFTTGGKKILIWDDGYVCLLDCCYHFTMYGYIKICIWKYHAAHLKNVQFYMQDKLNNDPPRDIYVLISRNCEFYIYMAKDFAAVIKLRILRWRDYPRLSRWTLNVITSIHMRGRKKEIWLQ